MDTQEKLQGASDNQLIRAYRHLRESRDAAKAAFTKSQKPTLEAMQSIETEMMRRLNDREGNSTKGDDGIAFISETPSGTVRDRTAFLEFLTETGNWNLVDFKANAPAVAAFAKENDGELPPGVSLTTTRKVNIRKAK